MLDITNDRGLSQFETIRPYFLIPVINNDARAVAIILGPGFRFRKKNVATKGKKKLTWEKQRRVDGVHHTFLLSQKGEPIRRLVYQNGMLIEIEENDTLHYKFIWDGRDREIPSRIINLKTSQQMYAWLDSGGRIQTKKLAIQTTKPEKKKKPRYIIRRK